MILRYVAVAVALAALGILVSAARSDQYPTLDTTREQMVKQWSQFSADDRRHCIAEATMGGDSSYTELLTCLEMARDVRQLHSQANSSSAPAQQVPPAPVGHRQPTQ
jgi:hypothetical protein